MILGEYSYKRSQTIVNNLRVKIFQHTGGMTLKQMWDEMQMTNLNLTKNI